ncbi:uncharacterized protein HMPREF1541_02230 [Cyphellophora europaea CBS 101466]|uniref:Methyltransferase type 11 domain-containing protein n=1 Tax=Cyphellophora europaea (strain CBS 101466) TaxID=1220924 RepID=W2S303_CYPE1|nr:uncharacterized protein HMPREF1541_02230 [Cyphellophora europaea CBS 101466]ETN43072.1 hypothetical protein HMPREF1541_02230 [Cyphellophora europaea CBS 101466]
MATTMSRHMDYHSSLKPEPATAQQQMNAYDATSSEQWKSYQDYRPEYPPSLFQRIYTFHVENGGRFEGTAHDAGCGPGITAGILSLQFTHVICSDFSKKAVDSARTRLVGPPQSLNKTTNANFSFKVASAEDMSWIATGTIDMVTMSEALHWTDTARTVAAAHQALKPGGTFAAWYYTQPRLPDNAAAETIFREIQACWCKLRRDFSKESERTLWVEQSGYDCVAFPAQMWASVERVKFNTQGNRDVWVRDWDLADMRYESQIDFSERVEFVQDASEWQQEVNIDWFRGWFESLFPTISPAYLDDMLPKLGTALGLHGSTRAVWPVVLLLASKKG